MEKNLQDFRLPSLDGWRAICIGVVILGHCTYTDGFPNDLKAPLNSFFDGLLAVRCFFVISGFIITHLILNEFLNTQKFCLKTFYTKRAFRIFPVYFIFLLFLYILQTFTVFHQSPWIWVQNLTFTTGLCYPHFFSWPSWHLWSLAVEEQFYIT